MNPIMSSEAGDILHRGDIIGVRYDHDNRSWMNKIIVDFQQNREMLPFPQCEISHVAVVGGGPDTAGHAQQWRGFEMQAPGGGREVHFLRDYSRCQFWIYRYDDWNNDAQRYRYCELAKQLSQKTRYSWTGVLHVAGLFPQIPGGRFCSELAELAAERAHVESGHGFLFMPANKISPARLCCAPLLRLVAVVYHKEAMK